MNNGNNNLASTFPEIAAQWHPTKNGSLLPIDVKPHSNKKAWWKCSNGHEWNASINSRSKGTQCPYCTGRHLSSGKDLESLYPSIASEWHPTKNKELKPSQVAAHSDKKVYWKCKKNHT